MKEDIEGAKKTKLQRLPLQRLLVLKGVILLNVVSSLVKDRLWE